MHLLTIWNDLLWQRILPVLLLLTAVVCGIRLHGRPVRGFGNILRETYGAILRRGAAPKQRQIFASALAATMGTGNLVGAALAVRTGGAGAVFWMWMSALLGMFLVYAENLLGIRFRRRHPDGTVTGGAPAYLRYGAKSPLAAWIFSFFCMIAALGMGNMAQSNTVSQTAQQFGIPAGTAGIVTAVLLGMILCGGSRRIGNVSQWLMPLLCGLYLLSCMILLIRQRSLLPAALLRIFREAFGLRAAGSGICISALLNSMQIGLRRGIFSNEAGLGSSALLHMEAEPDDAEMQGKWAAAEVFADTVICCTATALVILTAPPAPALRSDDAAGWMLHAFSAGFGGLAGGLLGICMMLFAFATMIGWYPCGAACARYLAGKRAEAVFFAGYLLFAFAGALGSPALIWTFCDCCNGMMALPNLWGLLRLSYIFVDNHKKH